MTVHVDYNEDARLTDFGRATLEDRYLLPNEKPQDMFARVASAYGDDEAHAQRMYGYISKHWFMPATPVLSNGGADRGLPISCFLNEAADTLTGIADLWYENIFLSAKGGGIGSYWGNLRSIGETVHRSGKTSGVIPFIKVQDAITLAIGQGSVRRGSAAVYLPVWHPEIEEFLDIRRPSGGDPNRKSLNVHHGVTITDEFMRAVEEGTKFKLRSPKDHHTVAEIDARHLWQKILTARLETGEPYVVFIDTVNESRPEIQKKLGLEVKMSNLCSEITLPTGTDHRNEERTAVCCLSSVNVEYFDEWRKDPMFIEDCLRFLDNALQDFINNAPDEMSRARYSAARERSVGLGVMGLHSYYQSKMVPWESGLARSLNIHIFQHIRDAADKASIKLAQERGACPDAQDAGIEERFSNKLAIAPTASISVIAGNASPGIEPYAANTFTQKTLTGSFTVRNKHLDLIIRNRLSNQYDMSIPHDVEQWHQSYADIWSSISTNEGSIRGNGFFTEDEQEVFKTAREINQKWLIEFAADRASFVCQAQSLNLFLPADILKKELHQLHMYAWKRGVKSLYYVRSLSMQRAEKEGKGDECLGCQ